MKANLGLPYHPTLFLHANGSLSHPLLITADIPFEFEMPRTKSPAKPTAVRSMANSAVVHEALLVSDYRSLRRAAVALGTSQSSLSRRIHAFEDQLGVSLFERHHAGVRLTHAGARFLAEARELLHQLESAAKAAGAAGRVAVRQLSFGIVPSLATGYLRDLVDSYRSQHPEITLTIMDGAPDDHVTRIRKRRLDVAFVADTAKTTECEATPLWTERVSVVLPESHRLAGNEQVEWQDLQDDHFLLGESDSALCERLKERFSELKQKPSTQKLKVGRETLMHLVALALGIGLATESAIATFFPNITFRPMPGGELIQFSAVWLPHADNPALRKFLSLARKLAKKRRSPSSAAAE